LSEMGPGDLQFNKTDSILMQLVHELLQNIRITCQMYIKIMFKRNKCVIDTG
jgi:hypothetical protein